MIETNDMLSGFLLINKPVGPTSHDIVNKMRRLTGIKKIGHAGTLDPFASGVLVMAIGRTATREIGNYIKLDKEYEAVLHLGAVTDTFDRTGKVEAGCGKLGGIVKHDLLVRMESDPANETGKATEEEIEEVLEKFRGSQLQIPPMFSAKKVGGRKLYELARKGIEIERAPVEINILKLKILSYAWPFLEIRVKCTSGTYIRTLAHDIGQALSCGAYLEELKRTAVGGFRLEQCASLDELDARNWQSFIN